MDASNESTITFYDIILDPTAYPSSPNPWKTRYALNFANVRYRTTWVPLSAVAETRNSLHLSANRTHQDGSPFPTLPIIRDPLVSGTAAGEVVVGDSFEIALHLQNTYLSRPSPASSALGPSSVVSPSPGKHQEQLFPAKDKGTVALHRVFNMFVDQLFSQYGAPLAGFYMPLDPRTAESDKAAFMQRFPGKGAWEDFEIPKGSEVRRKMLAEFEEALDTKLAPCFLSSTGGEGGEVKQKRGPFMDGREAPVYADFIVGGWLQFMRGCLPEWEDMRSKWSEGKWGRLFDALEEWANVDGREGVGPARR